VTTFPFGTLARRLTSLERRKLTRYLEQLLRWQRDLGRWPTPVAVQRAMPFVALYSSKGLRGCMGNAEMGNADVGSAEAAPRRVARAFLAALRDARFPEIASEERAELRAELALLLRPRRVDRATWLREFEAGTHGAALTRRGSAPAVLLADVALAHRADAPRFLDALAHKAQRAVGPRDELWIVETERVVASQDPHEASSGACAAAAWLAGMVRSNGEIVFSVDATTAVGCRIGPMHHARIAVAVRALAKHGGFERRVASARRRLAADLRSGLAGHDVEGWPSNRGMVAGTLALASLAGVDVRDALSAAATWPELRVSPWHAAQVALALGARTPAALWKTCVAALANEPWAPWTALAAHALGDARVLQQTLPVLAASIRAEPPHRGGVLRGALRGVPEVALTAIAVEALALGERTRGDRAALVRGCSFLERWQCLPGRVAGAIDLRTAHGAFLASPIDAHLRVDITAHALLALRGPT
jgi:AMMECR1 domain-containing protein